jgi:phosphatidylserine decarboxylase
VLVRQIAGFLARRIVTYLQPEQAVRAGEELGFIKFGSRCDVFLPVDANVLVALNQHVRGGETPIAQL